MPQEFTNIIVQYFFVASHKMYLSILSWRIASNFRWSHYNKTIVIYATCKINKIQIALSHFYFHTPLKWQTFEPLNYYEKLKVLKTMRDIISLWLFVRSLLAIDFFSINSCIKLAEIFICITIIIGNFQWYFAHKAMQTK